MLVALAALLLVATASAPASGPDPLPVPALPTSETHPAPVETTAPRGAEASSPKAAAEAFCAAVLDGDADAAAERLATPEPLWTNMDEFQAFAEANGLALLARPWRVSGEAGLGEERCRLWLTTNDDAPLHTFGLVLVRAAEGEWRIREVDGYDVAEALPADLPPHATVRVPLSEAEKDEFLTAYEDALSRGAFPDAFDAGFRLWEGGVLSYDDLNSVLKRWYAAALNGDGDMAGFEERAAQLYEATRDDSTPVRWRMYPDRAYAFPLNLKAAHQYHDRMAGFAKDQGDTDAMARHRRQALDALIQAYGFAKDRPAKVYLLDTAMPYYRTVARGGADDISAKEKRLYQATLLQHARSVLPRARRQPNPSKAGASPRTAAGPVRAADVYRGLHEEYQRLQQQSAQRAASRRSSR